MGAARVSFFLYRPHVVSADGTIVTPDLLIERVRYNGADVSPERVRAAGADVPPDGTDRAIGRIACGEFAIRMPARVSVERGVVATIELARHATIDGPADTEPGELAITAISR
jgi:hypothetical protein